MTLTSMIFILSFTWILFVSLVGSPRQHSQDMKVWHRVH